MGTTASVVKDQALDSASVSQLLKNLNAWTLKDNEIQKTFQFADFKEAMAFVNKVADAAERVDHHPDIFVSYSKVRLTLSTHSAGGLTTKDFDLARDIDFI